jgi:hypothetical protein
MPVAQEVVQQVMSSISKEDAILLEERLEVMRANSYDGLDRTARIQYHH